MRLRSTRLLSLLVLPLIACQPKADAPTATATPSVLPLPALAPTPPTATPPLTPTPAPTPPPAPAALPLAPEAQAKVESFGRRARLTERKEVVVDCVWFRGPIGPEASGGTSPVTVRIEPNAKPEASVGIIEEYAGGAGDMWRSAAWMAAFNASETLGYMLTDHEFLVRAGGHIDGPSAGMLTTAAMLAVLTGQPVRTDTTMSGTVNPDGSAGPVGGLPQKMQGAKAQGKTRFGYPVGCRNAQDLKTGQMVDLEVLGRDMGMEVQEIKDLREAYTFMTGKDLAALVLVPESEMALEPDLRTRVKAKLMSWQAELDQQLPGLDARIKKLPAEVKGYVLGIFGELSGKLAEAQRFEKSGLEVPAYNRFVQVAMMFRACMEVVEMLDALHKGDIARAEARLASLRAVEGKVKALALELGVNARKRTLGGTVNGVGAFAYYSTTYALMGLGARHEARAKKVLELIKAGKLPKKKEELQQLVMDLITPVAYYSMSDALIQVGRESMDFAPEEGSAVTVDEATLVELAKAYGSAASAGLAYFESTVVKSQADGAGVSYDAMQAFFRNEDGAYLLAPMLAQIAVSADVVTDGDKPETAMVRLSAGSLSFIQSAGLVNKYYSLRYQKDKSGVATIEHRRALSSQLDLAKRAALAAAGDAKGKAGFIPAAAKLAFEDASALREGTDADKLDALSAYWTSAFWSRLVVVLGGR